MSTFLSPQPFGIPAGATQATIQSTMDGKLTGQGWQRITYDTVNFISDFIPPVSETTGDGRFRQVARIYYNTADISISMYDYPITNSMSQMYRLWNKTAGAVAAAVSITGTGTYSITASISGTTLTVTATAGVLTIGTPITGAGVTAGTYITALGTGTGGTGTYVLNQSMTVASETMTATSTSYVVGATGSAGSTSQQNLYSLWTAIMAAYNAADPNVTLWKFTYLPNIAGVDTIMMEAQSIGATILPVLPNANVNGSTHSEPVLANTPSATDLASAVIGKFSLTIDRTNGFYIYMSIFSRSFNIAIKTTTSYYGWAFAYWMPNADALAAIPPKPPFMINSPCHIQEGFYGLVQGTAVAPTNLYSVRTSCGFGVPFTYSWVTQTTAGGLSNGAYNGAGGGGSIPGFFMSFNANGHYLSSSGGADTYNAAGLGISGSLFASPAMDLSNIALGVAYYTPQGIGDAGPYLTASYPSVYIEDVFVAQPQNTDGNEVTCVGPLQTPSNISLAQDLDDTTAYTSILLNTVTGLATVGTNYALIDNEVFSYTGVSGGNTLTGVIRAYNATPQIRHYTGTPVYQGGWFVKVNGGFAYMGTNRPTAA